MRKLHSLTVLLLAVFCLQICGGGIAESAQTINGKALGSVDDVVKEINRGDLSLQKKGLITLRGQVTVSKKLKLAIKAQHFYNQERRCAVYRRTPANV